MMSYDPKLPVRFHASEKYFDDEGNLRYRLVKRNNKFDEERQALFLEQIAEHGRPMTASKVCDVSMPRIREYAERNPEFAELYAEAMEAYKDRLLSHHQDLIFNGMLKKSYDRNGNLVSEEKIYPIPLIQMELRKHDEGYREKREVTMDVKGGVFVAPAGLSAEDWEKQFSPGGNQVEEAEVVEDSGTPLLADDED
jgi:hypothetical protein